MPRTYYTYILTNYKNTVLYTGVTNNIIRRIYEHKNHLIPGFTDKYNCTKLVYYKEFADINLAIKNEKSVKGMARRKKVDLINQGNPHWIDLSESWGISILSPDQREIERENMREVNRGNR